jgi:hypothetical protein
MSAVGAAPDRLDEVARGLLLQASGHAAAGASLRRAVAATPRASAIGAPALAALDSTGRGLDELGRGFDDLARFVAQVAEALRAADDTLAGAAGGPRVDLWRSVGDTSGSGSWRAYAGGARRSVTGTVSDPFRPGRARTVVRRDGAVQDGFGNVDLGVTAWQANRTFATGTGAGVRRGNDTAHVAAEAFGGGMAEGRVTTSYANGQAQVAFGGSAMAGGVATARAHVGNEYVAADAQATVFGGARVEAEAKVGVGKDGVDIEVDARALFGGEAEAEAAVEVLGVRGAANAAVSYGVGGEFAADVDVGLDEIGFSFDLGVTFGLGVSFGADVSVSPRDLGRKGAGAAQSVWRKLT